VLYQIEYGKFDYYASYNKGVSMDISLIFRIAAVGLITAIVNQILKKVDKDEIATVTTLAGLVIVLLMVIDMLASLFESLQRVFGLF